MLALSTAQDHLLNAAPAGSGGRHTNMFRHQVRCKQDARAQEHAAGDAGPRRRAAIGGSSVTRSCGNSRRRGEAPEHTRVEVPSLPAPRALRLGVSRLIISGAHAPESRGKGMIWRLARAETG